MVMPVYHSAWNSDACKIILPGVVMPVISSLDHMCPKVIISDLFLEKRATVNKSLLISFGAPVPGSMLIETIWVSCFSKGYIIKNKYNNKK